MFNSGVLPSVFEIRAGSNTVSTGGQLVRVVLIVEHESFNSRSLINDIAILKLESRLLLSSTVRAIQLPVLNFAVPNAAIAAISGWGGINTRGDRPIFLQTINVPIIGNTQCSTRMQSTVRADQLCAGGVTGRDVCGGEFYSNFCKDF